MGTYPYRIWRACKRKIIYYTLDEAAKAAKELEAKDGEPMMVYGCDYGNHWHVAHVTPYAVRMEQPR